MIDRTLAHYRITAAIGAGGMGEVYRATDTKLGRAVALKVLPAAFTQDADRLARIEREARLLAALNHPGIAPVSLILNWPRELARLEATGAGAGRP